MKNLIAILFVSLAMAVSGAVPDYKAFRGTGGLIITSNPPPLGDGTIMFDTSGISSPTGGVSAATATGIVTTALSYLTTNVVWVSKAGKDTTAARSRIDLPAQTLTKAKAIAIAGDTILVLPGYYEGTNLWKNAVNWHFFNGVTVTNISANPSGIFDNTALGTQGAITSNITGDGIFIVAHTDTSNTNETGVISIVNSNCVISVKCQAIYGSPDNSSFYALCLRDGFSTDVQCNEIDATLIFGFSNSAILWNNGAARLRCGHVKSDVGYGIWGNGFKPDSFYVDVDLMESLEYDFVFWQPTSAENKLWLRASELKGALGGVSVGAFTQTGGKVYIEAQKISTFTQAPVFYLSAASSASQLWVRAQKVSTTDAPYFYQLGGVADFHVDEWRDDTAATTRAMAWRIEGGTNYMHGGRVNLQGGPFAKLTGGLSYFKDAIIRTSEVGQSTNYPVWMNGGSAVIQNCTLVPPWQSGAVSIFAGTSRNVTVYGGFASTNAHANVTVLVGPWTIDSNVQ